MNEAVVRILVVDDHPIVRDGLTAVLSTQADFAVVGDADNGASALQKIDALRPDVILLDLQMPAMDGVEVLRALQGRADPPPVIVFTAFDADERIVDAIRAGARGYLLKGAPRAELFQAIRTVHAGGSLLQPVIASRLIQRLAHEPAPDRLTKRELEVLRLMARGSANRDIAGQLVITERTVKFHVSSILGKLNAHNRTEAVAVARQRGLLSQES